MFIAVLFIIVKNWKQPCPHWWVVKPTRASHARGDCPNIREPTTGICEGDLQKSQSQKITSHVMPFMGRSGRDRIKDLEHGRAAASVRQKGGEGVSTVSGDLRNACGNGGVLHGVNVTPGKGDKGSLRYLIQLHVKTYN